MSTYFTGWDHGWNLLRSEAIQLKEEGRDATWIDQLLASAPADLAETQGAALWTQLQEAPMRSGFDFVEPSDLVGIRAERQGPTPSSALSFSSDTLFDRLHGAWVGRCCGCALGKPVELFNVGHRELSSRERIKLYLLGAGDNEYPLRDYFPASSSVQAKTGALTYPASQRGMIKGMETDDDIRYTVLGQMVLADRGADFRSNDVMGKWLWQLPYGAVCTAETQAYRNFLMRYQMHDTTSGFPDWSWVATHQNPYREWIGAQIRADSWGYAAPGRPTLAAEFAWRDARISHVKNGIYGEMFVAAMIAAAFTHSAPLDVIEAGLAEIPRRSRLYADLRATIAICQRHDNDPGRFEEVFDEIQARLGHYDWGHTINNAALVVAALLLGGDDFEKAITLAVMGGWDTDCNGATVGSIFGAMHGVKALPEKWKAPLQDTLYAGIIGYHPIAISECARRSVAIAEKIAG